MRSLLVAVAVALAVATGYASADVLSVADVGTARAAAIISHDGTDELWLVSRSAPGCLLLDAHAAGRFPVLASSEAQILCWTHVGQGGRLSIWTSRGPKWSPQQPLAMSKEMLAASVSPDGRYLVCCTRHLESYVYSLARQRFVACAGPGWMDKGLAAAWSGDGKTVAMRFIQNISAYPGPVDLKPDRVLVLNLSTGATQIQTDPLSITSPLFWSEDLLGFARLHPAPKAQFPPPPGPETWEVAPLFPSNVPAYARFQVPLLLVDGWSVDATGRAFAVTGRAVRRTESGDLEHTHTEVDLFRANRKHAVSIVHQWNTDAGPPARIALSSDGERLVIGDSRGLRVMSALTGDLLWRVSLSALTR